MKLANSDGIDFCDSYLLGWDLGSKEVVIYVEFLLTKSHPMFEAYDASKEYGCFKLGKLVVNKVSSYSGFPNKKQLPERDAELNEYIDIAEIDNLTISGSSIKICADDYILEVEGKDAEVLID